MEPSLEARCLCTADVRACMLKVESLKHAKQACYDGTLLIKAFSSGLEIGACNWSISGPKGSIAYISNAVSSSATAMSFNHKVLEGSDVVVCSNFSRCNDREKFDDDTNSSDAANAHISNSSDSDLKIELRTILEDFRENLEELEKLDFILFRFYGLHQSWRFSSNSYGTAWVNSVAVERFSFHTVSENIEAFKNSPVAEDSTT